MPDGAQIPTWVWWFIIKSVALGIFAVGLIVVAVVWKTGKLPFSGQSFRAGKDHDRRARDEEKMALLQIVKDNTAAMQALRSLGEDSKSITLSSISKLDDMGKVLASMVQKLADMHDDVRPKHARG
jgi:hypothetical protein